MEGREKRDSKKHLNKQKATYKKIQLHETSSRDLGGPYFTFKKREKVKQNKDSEISAKGGFDENVRGKGSKYPLSTTN